MANDHNDRAEDDGGDGGASRFGWLRAMCTPDGRSTRAREAGSRGGVDGGVDREGHDDDHGTDTTGTVVGDGDDVSRRKRTDIASPVMMSDGGDLDQDQDRDRDRDRNPDAASSEESAAADDVGATTAWDGLAADGQGGVDVEAKVAALTELLGGTGNVLLAGPADRPIEHELCAALTEDTGTATADATAALNLLLVTTDPDPNRRVDVCRSHLSAAPRQVAVINPQTRGSDETVTMAGVDPEAITVQRLSNPGDLRRLGIMISRQLSAWDDIEGQTVLCVRSLSALFRRVDEELLFRFLYILRDRIDSADATAHYHLDPAEHDGQVLDRFDPVFDAIVQYGEDRSVTID